MAGQKIRIKLAAYDHEMVDQATERIIEAMKKAGAKISGPIPLPTEKEIVTILRSPHKYKDSREQFEIRTHKRLIDTLICGGIGGGAQMALTQAGIKLYGGVSGSTDAAVEALLGGTLGFDPNVKCDHHDHHGEGHTCGNHGCGHCH